MENKKNTRWLVGIGVILVIVIVFWFMNKKSAPESLVDQNEDQSIESVEDTSEGSENVGNIAATISYQDALVKYKNARIQLDKTCQASPDKMTFKNNTTIMIDNRSAIDRVVKVGSTFNLKAYGFKLVKLSSATLPATWLVDCDNSQNVSTILIQK